jgi:hypothetical protein
MHPATAIKNYIAKYHSRFAQASAAEAKRSRSSKLEDRFILRKPRNLILSGQQNETAGWRAPDVMSAFVC